MYRKPHLTKFGRVNQITLKAGSTLDVSSMNNDYSA